MSLVDTQKKFYADLFAQHGDDPRSLSWRDSETQHERFARITKLFDREQGSFTVHEIGCGLGHFGDFLAEHHPRALYSGSDILPEFVTASQKRFPESEFFERDVSASLPKQKYDFVTLSGTFNLRLQTPVDPWKLFITNMLGAMYKMCTKGIAANFLSTCADAALMQNHLHYQSAAELIDHVSHHLSRHYELDHAGPFFEYTLRVYRPAYVRSCHPSQAFAKYFKPSDLDEEPDA